jgi:hypothetical protein
VIRLSLGFKKEGIFMVKKYELTKDSVRLMGHTLYRIKALRDFGDVKKGDLGGYIEKESNLSHGGTCWVADQGMVLQNASVSEHARVHERAVVFGNARLAGRISYSILMYLDT